MSHGACREEDLVLTPRIHPDKQLPAPTLAELQQRVDAWIGQFEAGYWPPLSMLARLTEEVGELAREINHLYGHKPKKAEEPPGDLALEVADIIFVLVCLSNSLGIDLGEAFERVMHKYDTRDARRWTPKQQAAPAETPQKSRTKPRRRPARVTPSPRGTAARRAPRSKTKG
jgi:NTP pyrophosphatase (non-canonical NTP hydrolase)